MEKLSVKAPDGPTKNKLLKEIATEHNVTWEALVEPDPKETVLSVSNYIFISLVLISSASCSSICFPQ